MQITSLEIINKINSDFCRVYKPFSNFPNSGVLWDECIDAVRDAKLLNNIIFCNDILQIPPTKVFLAAKNIAATLSDDEKKAVGAFWGFVFKFVFLYRNQKNVSIRINSVKSATYFFDAQQAIEVLV